MTADSPECGPKAIRNQTKTRWRAMRSETSNRKHSVRFTFDNEKMMNWSNVGVKSEAYWNVHRDPLIAISGFYQST
jgi:hypothetical protein